MKSVSEKCSYVYSFKTFDYNVKNNKQKCF